MMVTGGLIMVNSVSDNFILPIDALDQLNAPFKRNGDSAYRLVPAI